LVCRLHRSEVEVDLLVDRGAGQGVAGGVRPDRVDQVGQVDHRAGPLAHPHRLAVAHEVDQLAEQDLQVARRVVAHRGHQRLVPADVAGVVGAQHDHDLVEAAVALVQVVRRSRRRSTWARRRS
jgi:hypothetical protein